MIRAALHRLIARAAALCLLMALIANQAGCQKSRPNSNANPHSPASQGEPVDEPVMDYASLVEKLRASGAVVAPGDEVSQPFFSVAGRAVVINGEAVQIFEYASVEQAQSEARRVDPSGGSVGTTMIDWVAAPHFYKSGRLIAIYVGADEETIKLLESVMGKQFAGR